MAGPLDGIRIIDLSWGSAGPLATGLMAAYGADVLRVEPPGGDPYRGIVDAYAATRRATRAIELDLRAGADRERLHALLADADVLIESWRPGVAARLGLGVDELRHRYQGLVVCSISGYGQDGPDRDRPGIDALVEARLGMMASQAGGRDGPIYLGVHVSGMGAGLLAVSGILAALHARAADGRGRHVDTSLLDGALAYMAMYWSQGETPIRPLGNQKPAAQWTVENYRHRLIVGNFECADGEYLGVHTGATGAHARFIAAVGLTAHVPPAKGPSEKSEPVPEEAAEYLAQNLTRVIRARPRAEWIARLLDADVCVMPVLRPGEAFDLEQVRHNGLIIRAALPDGNLAEQVGPPLRFHEASTLRIEAAPAPAAHWSASARAALPATATTATGAPLAGIRVIDFGAFVAGPFASRILGDLGADVIRIEGLHGDNMRPTVPPFNSANRNKRSLAVDFKSPAGREIGSRLLAWTDVAQHNMRPGAAERLGLDYESARAINPRIVYLYSPGWGVDGPDADRMGFAPLFSGVAGLQFLAGGASGTPRPPVGNEDNTNGLLGACAALMALYRRDVTGHGELVVSPQISATIFMAPAIMRRDGHLLPVPRLDAEQCGLSALDRLYRCSDGWICLWAERDREFGALARALGRESLVSDPRFASVTLRRANDTALASLITPVLASHSAAHWLGVLDAAGVPCEIPAGESRDRFLKDPVNLGSRRVARQPHPQFGTVWDIGTLIRIDGAAPATDRRAPLLGEHTDEILAGIGYSGTEIARLREQRVVR
ncbi:MAG: CaiB/BaiF CoA transferase family protein [Gammaproteobacteria bacterium]